MHVGSDNSVGGSVRLDIHIYSVASDNSVGRSEKLDIHLYSVRRK